MVTFKTKQEIISKLKAQILKKDSTAIHTLLFVYNNQVDDEKLADDVKYHNGIGFKRQDAKKGSAFAKWYKEKGFFTAKQLNVVKSMVEKYAGQVIKFKINSDEIYKQDGIWIWK